MSTPQAEDLARFTPVELRALVRELRAANEILRATATGLPSAAESLLDDQIQRTSLLTQLAIEFREAIDPATIVAQTLRAIMTHLAVSGASIILVGPDHQIELASSVIDGAVMPLDHELAAEVISRGLGGWVLRHGSSVALSDVARDRRWLEFSERHRSGSVIVIPVRQSSAILGVLTTHRQTAYAFNSHDLILLEGVAAQLGVALSAARHLASERQRRSQAMDLLQMSQVLSVERPPTTLATLFQTRSREVFGARLGVLFLVQEDGDLQPVLPDEEPLPTAEAIALVRGAARLAWASQRIATTGPTPELTCLALPLSDYGVSVGAYTLLHSNAQGLEPAAWPLLMIFGQLIAAACANLHLVQRLRDQTHSLETLVNRRTQQLQRSRDMLRVVFDSIGEGLLLLDAEDRVLAANNHFCTAIVGIHPREVVGQAYTRIWQQIERSGPLAVSLAADNGDGRIRLNLQQPARRRSFSIERTPIKPSGKIERWQELLIPSAGG